MYQNAHRTDRTAETRSTPARGPAPAERTPLLDVQRTLGNAAALHLLRQAGHPYAGAERAGDVPVQRFMEPRPSGEPGAWRRQALAYFDDNKERVLKDYTRLVLDEEPDGAAMGRILKDLKILGDWQTVAAAARAARGGADTAGTTVDTALTNVLRQLNRMEQERATADTARQQDEATPLKDSLAGTEFTFTDSTLNGTVKKDATPLIVDLDGLTGKAEAQAKAVITYARGRMDAWAAQVAKTELPGGTKPAVSDTTVKGQPAKRFTYTLSSSTWWWEITMDDTCLETRTAPTSIKDLNSSQVRAIVDRHIFALAAKCGLHVDQSAAGGGGHLSLDSKSTFGGSVELFVQSMREWEAQWRKWVEHFSAGEREKDEVNAPWTGDLPQGETHREEVDTTLREILRDAHRGDVDLSGAIGRLHTHMRTLPLHANATPRLREKLAKQPDDRLHYQAVNLEHMNASTEAHRRVEFRDIQAQSGYDQLLADLGHIGRMLQGVRVEADAEQRGRLGTLHKG